MGATEKAAANIGCGSRLKREECRRTKHDSAFSHWKILIGNSDWEDHSQGKEGADKYRVQNLPNCISCPGVYELGIAIKGCQSGQEARKLDPAFTIPVYLGKAENVRNRLQQYGREGAHLENGSSICKNGINQKGPQLFSEVFSKGFSIVYRWAPMKSPSDAEKTEAELLNIFDYAWNKGSNGPRRPKDILKRIDHNSKTSQFLAKFQLLLQKQKGIKIKACKVPLVENDYSLSAELQPKNVFYPVLKFGRSQPRLVQWRSGINEDSSICGVALGHGDICTRLPAAGRKRCAEHKGMRVNGVTSKLLTEGKFTLAPDKSLLEKDISPVCGVILDDGSSCTREAVQGNRRCLEHKGQKICDSIPCSVKDEKGYYVHGPFHFCDNQYKSHATTRSLKSFSGKPAVNKDCNTVCGVHLDDGTFCTRQPPARRKRCEEHKGTRVK